MALVSRFCAHVFSIALTASTIAMSLFIADASAQDAAKSTAPPAVTTAPPAAATPPAAGTTAPAVQPAAATAKEPALPEVKIIQEKPAAQPVQEAAPKPQAKPAPVVEAAGPVPAPRPKKTKKAAASAPKPAAKPSAPPPQNPQAVNVTPVVNAEEAAETATAEALNSPNAATAASAKLDVKNTTGSALNLTPRETPATVSIVSQKDIEEKGTRGLVETLRSIPGVHVSNNPGEVGTTVTRGFQKATGFAIDGSRVADPVFLPRDFSSFHFDRVELLRGPASVVSGTSGLAGTFNIVTKKASADRTFGEAMISYGSFGTLETGVGLNVAISPQAAVRTTATFSNSNGYVDDTPYEKYGFTNNILLKPLDDLKLTASIDYFKDDLSPYYGTPLVPLSLARQPTDVVSSNNGRVIDKSIRYNNYDFLDTIMTSESLWLRGAADYRLSDQWKIRNELNYYTADRLWRDADFYDWTAAGITRGITLISHDHQFWSDRFTASFDGLVGGYRNRFTAGAEYLVTNFGTNRHFGTAATVDIFNPDRGTFPAIETAPTFNTLQYQSSEHLTKAAFAEHAINLTPAWLITAGVRYETIDLDRSILNKFTGATQVFGNDLESTTWRVGSTYEILPGTTIFGQYATAVTPVSALMIASVANSRFDLTTGNTVEFGFKSTSFDRNVTTTGSIYRIEQDNIITRTSANVAVQGGSQRSRGVELDTAISLTDRWNLTLAGTLIDTEFTELRTATTNLKGNRPVNAFPWAWSALMTYRLEGLPATIGAQLIGTGPFYTSNANLYEARDRTVLDAWVAFDVGQGVLRLRGRNLTDELYAEGTDYSPTSLYLAPPRSYDVTYTVKW